MSTERNDQSDEPSSRDAPGLFRRSARLFGMLLALFALGVGAGIVWSQRHAGPSMPPDQTLSTSPGEGRSGGMQTMHTRSGERRQGRRSRRGDA